MNKQDFTLFWAIAPSAQDWANLITSGVSRVMITYQLATSDTDMLVRLSTANRRVIIRLEDNNQRPPAEIARALNDIRHVVPIDAVIVGNEPDGGFNMRYGSPSWGQLRAYESAMRTSYLVEAVRGLGLPVVSPPMSHPPDAISEDGPPLPGRVTFREIVAPKYQEADGCGLHIYALGWGFNGQDPTDVQQVNRDRFKFALKAGVENWHRPCYIDEVGVILGGDDVLQMRAYLEMADIIMRSRCNDRVKMFCPFISAGDPGSPPAWDARFILSLPAAYALLGAWMTS